MYRQISRLPNTTETTQFIPTPGDFFFFNHNFQTHMNWGWHKCTHQDKLTQLCPVQSFVSSTQAFQSARDGTGAGCPESEKNYLNTSLRSYFSAYIHRNF